MALDYNPSHHVFFSVVFSLLCPFPSPLLQREEKRVAGLSEEDAAAEAEAKRIADEAAEEASNSLT